MNFHCSFTAPSGKNTIKSQIPQDFFHSNFYFRRLLHAGRTGTQGELKAQYMQSQKQNFEWEMFVQNWYLLPSTCTGWWNPKWQTLNMCIESVVWATSMHWARRLRELVALDDSSGVWGVSSHCLRAVWWLHTVCCNPQSKHFNQNCTMFSTPHRNINIQQNVL